jgi:phage tail-like protein
MTAGRPSQDPHATFRFGVSIEGINQATFSECTLPALEVELHEQKEGGYNYGVHQVPGRVKAGRVTLKKGLAKSSELLKWYQQVLSGKVQEATKNVTVMVYDPSGQGTAIMTLVFERAYPVKWSAPALKTSESTIAIETLELAFAEVKSQE